ncbi:MAG: hypothetical protein KGN33_14330, partial [Paracoccaceae bacterium]|nr:hypothetical protein [Paracoccaceae bacterium]
AAFSCIHASSPSKEAARTVASRREQTLPLGHLTPSPEPIKEHALVIVGLAAHIGVQVWP